VEPVEIRADDLLLRPWQPADAAVVHRACQDPVLRHWADLPAPYPMEDAARFVGELAPSLLADDVAVPLGVFDADSGELLGSADLRALDRRNKTAELGYWSAPWARGRRVAERASRALLRWGFDELGLLRVDWKATVGNHASRLTGLRLGFRMIGVQPESAKRREQWLAALVPGDLSADGHQIGAAERRQAIVFGGPRPILRAGAVTLRPPAAKDQAAILAAGRDPDIIRWFGMPDPYTNEDVRRYIHDTAPLEWARGTEAIFAIAGPDDAYAGAIDVRVGSVDPEVGEVGFFVGPQARGRGYASSALRALAGWAFAELGLARLQWRAEVGNDASRRVAEKAGFTMEGLLRQAYEEDGRRRDCWVGSLLPRELSAAAPVRVAAELSA
jgi:RimJ/RimL family protein N-acetyltransferase